MDEKHPASTPKGVHSQLLQDSHKWENRGE